MAPTLYSIHASPPCRAVYLCAKAIDLDLNIKDVNVFALDHLKPEYIEVQLIFAEEKIVSPKKFAALEEAYSITEKFLEKTPYIAGDQLTVADFSYVADLTTSQVFLPISEAKYPKITAWIKKLEKLPYYKEANLVGLNEYFSLVKPHLATLGFSKAL